LEALCAGDGPKAGVECHERDRFDEMLHQVQTARQLNGVGRS
jgi:hypothetical protein